MKKGKGENQGGYINLVKYNIFTILFSHWESVLTFSTILNAFFLEKMFSKSVSVISQRIFEGCEQNFAQILLGL